MLKRVISIMLIAMSVVLIVGCSNKNISTEGKTEDTTYVVEPVSDGYNTNETVVSSTKPRNDDDLLFSKITVGNDTLTLPCKLQDVLDKGYEINEDDVIYEYGTVDKLLNKELTHTENNEIISLIKDDINLYVSVYNGENITGSQENVKCKDSFVWTIGTDPTKKYDNTQVFLSNGLSIGTDIDDIGFTDISWHDTDGYVYSKSKLYTLKIFTKNNKINGLGIVYNFEYDR